MKICDNDKVGTPGAGFAQERSLLFFEKKFLNIIA
jgi:hypothetical protein